MRRCSVILSVCLLCACSSQQVSVPHLPPEEVLQRAAKATQTLDSAQYTIQADFDTNSEVLSVQGKAQIDGSLREAGKQLRFLADISADIKQLQERATVDGAIEIIMMSEDEVYVRVHSLQTSPSDAMFSPVILAAISGGWWLLPADNPPPIASSITPDPRLLEMQSHVISVERDRGIDTISGRDAYHYDVVINTEKLLAYLSEVYQKQNDTFDRSAYEESFIHMQAQGELWIDAENFYMQKLQWEISDLPLDGGDTASVAFTVHFRNHNSTPQITPPADAKQFTPEALFALPQEALFPEELLQNASDPNNDRAIEDLIRHMNSLQQQ